MRRHLNATPRTSIQAALTTPYYYLQVCQSSMIKRETVISRKETESNSKILNFCASTECFFPLAYFYCRMKAWRPRTGLSPTQLPTSASHTSSIWSAAGWLTSTTGWKWVPLWNCTAGDVQHLLNSPLPHQELHGLESLFFIFQRRLYWSFRINVSHDRPTVDSVNENLFYFRPMLW